VPVGVGRGEEVKVGAAGTAGDEGALVGDTVEPTDGVERAGIPSPHAPRQSKNNIGRTLKYLLTTPLLEEDSA
jgi:hypothetical protein